MKTLQKFILPLLIITIIFFIYSIYFSPSEGLGSFSNFDTNNTGNKDIKVEIVRTKEIKEDKQNQSVSFYAKDKDGKEVLVEAPLPLPNGFDDAKTIFLRGHLHPDHFHAAEILLK